MSKTQTTYIVMILAFSLGLWAILRVGSHLHAAINVAGEWKTEPANPGSGPPFRVILSQSGRFLNGTLHLSEKSNEIRLRGKLEDQRAETGGMPPGRVVILKGTNSDITLTATLDESGEHLSGRFQPGPAVDWQASRTASPGPH